MMQNSNTTRVAFGMTLAVLAGGCQQDKPTPYGSGMSAFATPAPDVAPPRPVVPAGAEMLSQGTYNQIQFQLPSRPGLLYVFDHDTNMVVGTTNSAATDAGKTMTMADLKNTAQGLSMTDHYQIYFAPSIPTTRPMGGM